MNYDAEAISNAYQEASDLDFELLVHESLKRLGCISNHGGRYLDHITGKMREYDIFASPPGARFNGGTAIAEFHKLELVVECKNIAEHYPLIVGARPFESEEITALELRRSHASPMSCFASEIPIARMSAFPQLFGMEFISYVGVEVMQLNLKDRKSQRQDNASLYDKWSQAISHAVVRYLAMIDSIAKNSTMGQTHIWCPAILVVPDQRLLLAARDSSGLNIKPIEGISIKVGYDFESPCLLGTKASISNYFIMTVSGLKKFIGLFGR